MEIAIGTGFFTKGDVDVNSGHLAKIRKICISSSAWWLRRKVAYLILILQTRQLANIKSVRMNLG